ncbi:head decoration protein [Selenomonadales bacterium OttesenSCG-928-I06]|nr:head decoration protein [Selenomonadales bacterium OttesenSCG-928-I06]
MAYTTSINFGFDQLIGGTEPTALLKVITVASGQGILKRGSVLGVVTDSGKGKLVDSASTDGSETAKYVLAKEIDTTEGDVDIDCYMSGMFNREYLTVGGSDEIADHEEALRGLNIYLTSEKYHKEG